MTLTVPTTERGATRGAVRAATPRPDPSRRRRPGPLPTAVIGASIVLAVATVAAVVRPDGAVLAAAGMVAVLVGVVAVIVLLRRPWWTPWLVVLVFSTSGELRLRVDPVIGLAKDAVLALLLVTTCITVWRTRAAVRRRLRPFAAPLACLCVLALLYVVDAAGGHGTPWLFGSRLLLSACALLMIGLLVVEPARCRAALVTAMTVTVVAEAAFAWLQQAAGADALVFRWGYQYGAQVRVTSDGGLRTSGTFEDPFQLAALAVLAIAVGLFVARGRQATILVLGGIALLGATSVRTAILQVAVLLLVWAIRAGFAKQAAVVAVVGAAAALLVLSTTTTAIRPGAPEEPLLLTLNGRSTAWAQAVVDWRSFVTGNGVGARGIGSTRTSTVIESSPAYDPDSAPVALFAGDPAFLDSAYAQVLSDVGIVGVAALLAGTGGIAVIVFRRARRRPANGAAWAAGAVVLVSAADWIGRSSLASYTTGYLTLFVLGVLLAASDDDPSAAEAALTPLPPGASR